MKDLTEASRELYRLRSELTELTNAAANIALEIRLLRNTLNRIEEAAQCDAASPSTTQDALHSTTD